MAGSLNKVMLIGRLGKDPEMRFTPSGRAVTTFSVATDESWTDQGGEKQERTEWHRIVTWGKLAENCAKLLTKGKLVYLECKLQTRSYDDKEGTKRTITEIIAYNMTLLTPKGNGGDGGSAQGGASQGMEPAAGDESYLDDIPF